MSNVVINEQKTFKEKLQKYLVGFVIVFYFSMTVGATWVPDCTIGEWLSNYTQFIIVEHHFFVGFTKISGQVILFFEFCWTIFFLVRSLQIEHPFAGREYGDAHWSTIEEVSVKCKDTNENNLVKVNFGDYPEPKEPVYVNTNNYWFAEDVYLSIDNTYTSNLNIEVVGPPGTGKSFRLARPILSQLAGSYLVTDPKGELSQQSGQFFEDNDYGVFVINCESEMGMTNSHHFNPFKYMENESDLLTLAEILFKSTRPADASSGDQFFEDMAQIELTCIFYLMFYTYPKEKQDWRNFVELLNSTTVKQNPQTGAIDTSDPNHIYQRFIRANEKWKSEHNGEELKGFVDIEKIYTNAPETASSIVSSLDAHAKFMKLDCVVDLLSSDDLDFINTFGYGKKTNKAKSGKYILYLVTSENVRHFDWIPSMIYSMFFEKLYSLTTNDKSLHQTLPNHLTCLMDEFANVTLPGDFVGLTSTMRSRGLSVIIIIQNLHQLKAKFPKDDADKNLRANMCTTIILGGPDNDSCKTLSEEFGKQTIHKQTQGLTRAAQGSSSINEDVMEHPLLSSQDIHEMDKDGPCAIKIKGVGKLWVPKVRFQDSPLCPLLTRKEPYEIKRIKLTGDKIYDLNKSFLEQMPTIYFGSAAESFISECKAEDISVVKLDNTRLSMLSLLQIEEQSIPGTDASTNTFWESVAENTKRLIKEKQANEINFDNFKSDEMLVIQQLKNNGFSGAQINALSSLICNDYKYDDIVKYFNSDMPVDEIASFTNKLQSIKNEIA